MDTFLIINWIAFLMIAFYGLYLFAKAILTRVSYIRLGKKTEFDGEVKMRLRRVLQVAFGHSKLFKDKKSGLMHVFILYGFFIIQLGLIELIIKGVIPGFVYPLGTLHNAFSLLQEVTFFLMFLAVMYGAYRRYGEGLRRLQWKRDGKALFVYIGLGTLTITIPFALGIEKVMLGSATDFVFAPFSSLVAVTFSGLGVTAGTILFYVFWWLHMIAVFSFMVFVPQSKQAHEILAFFNVFFSKKVPGKLEPVNFDMDEEDVEAEEEIAFGVGKIEDFSRRSMLDFFSCTECGRCTDVCPAAGTGKMLSPMDIMIKLRDHLTEKGAAVTGKQAWVPSYAFSNTSGNQATAGGEVAATIQSASLIGDVITEAELNACTTCRNCEDACPVMNEHVGTIIDMRRYLVMTEGKMDSDIQRAVMNIERQGNPWGLSKKDRIKWRDEDESVYVPTVKELKKEGKEFEYLFWVSSMGSYDSRSQKIAIAVAKLMNKAGINFAILGNQEANSGDTARRIGNEFLFQEIAEKNIKTFEKHGVKKIVTIDPHAYNIFKNEYPDFGYEAEVLHHTQLLYDLVQSGKLKPQREINEKLTYHDSCYLGRYNGVYDPPREILQSIPGLELVEMNRSRENAMCCGAGGGLMWAEDTTGNRINVARTEQALAVEPTMISTACPFCLTMISDGTKAKEVEEDISTMDVAEILALSVLVEETEKIA